jgi:hypothetical protein
MIIFSAEYNDCIYESAFGTISLHRTYEGACDVIDKDKRRKLKQWKKSGHDTIPDYEQWRVREIKLLD